MSISRNDIKEGIDITIEALRRAHPEFNPNDDSSYIGLDEDACHILLRAMEMLYGSTGRIITGVIKYSIYLPPVLWNTTHSWVIVDGYHIDITCAQYKKYIKRIPSVYIERKKPKWFVVYEFTILGRICSMIYKLKHREGT